MMNSFDLLDRYFSNNLNKSEIRAFNERLQNDPEFNQEFQEIKEIKLAVKGEARKNIKYLLSDIEESLEKEDLPINNNQLKTKRIITVLASLMLMVSISYFVLNRDGGPRPQDIFTQYYKPYMSAGSEVKGDTSISDKAYSAYNAKNYALALKNFEKLVAFEKNAANYLYMGIANIELGEYETAIQNLNSALNNFSAFDNQARWYLGLALLANNNEEESLSLFASLVLKNGLYGLKGKSVLKAMGYSFDKTSTESAVVTVLAQEPNNQGESFPEGVFIPQRQIQFGEISSLDEVSYRFANDLPIKGLKEGDLVQFIALNKNKRSKSWAHILDQNIR